MNKRNLFLVLMGILLLASCSERKTRRNQVKETPTPIQEKEISEKNNVKEKSTPQDEERFQEEDFEASFRKFQEANKKKEEKEKVVTTSEENKADSEKKEEKAKDKGEPITIAPPVVHLPSVEVVETPIEKKEQKKKTSIPAKKNEGKNENKVKEKEVEKEVVKKEASQITCSMNFETLLSSSRENFSESIHLKMKNIKDKDLLEGEGTLFYKKVNKKNGEVLTEVELATGTVSFTELEETQKLNLAFVSDSTPVSISDDFVLASSVEFNVIKGDCSGDCHRDIDSYIYAESGFYAFDNRDAEFATQKIDTAAICHFPKDYSSKLADFLF